MQNNSICNRVWEDVYGRTGNDYDMIGLIAADIALGMHPSLCARFREWVEWAMTPEEVAEMGAPWCSAELSLAMDWLLDMDLWELTEAAALAGWTYEEVQA